MTEGIDAVAVDVRDRAGGAKREVAAHEADANGIARRERGRRGGCRGRGLIPGAARIARPAVVGPVVGTKPRSVSTEVRTDFVSPE